MISISTIMGMLLLGAAETPATYKTTCAPAMYEAWSIQYEADGTQKGEHNRSNTYCYYDGRADMSEYRGLDENNDVYYHGVSVTIWDEARETGRTLWAMVGTDGYTDIRVQWDGDILVSENKGHEPEGAFIGKTRTFFYPGGDYKFVMDRSYDSGESWIAPRNTIEYLKTPTPPPALPTEWSPRMAFGKAFAGEGGMIILDGNAWGKFVENDEGEPSGFIFASVAPNGEDGWVWRTLTWTFDGGIIDVADTPLQ